MHPVIVINYGAVAKRCKCFQSGRLTVRVPHAPIVAGGVKLLDDRGSRLDGFKVAHGWLELE